MDWDAVFQSAASALVVSGIVIATFRFYVEKRIEHSFDRKLAEYEARLSERSELRVKYGTDRLSGYQNLVSQIRRVNRRCRDWLESELAADHDVAELLAETAKLQEAVYAYTVSLELDGLYAELHVWKGQMQSIAKRLDNAARLDGSDQTRAASVREAVRAEVPARLVEGNALADRLTALLGPLAE